MEKFQAFLFDKEDDIFSSKNTRKPTVDALPERRLPDQGSLLQREL